MRELKEVINPEEANTVVVISEAWGRNLVRKKVYFQCPGNIAVSDCIRYVLDNYSDVVGYDTRIDTYNVRNGRTIGRC
ncbi:MAG TPA: hypothetical protein DCW90_17860 [Lachnospiraceae bacterium]|nr:hypothetical protein [Lachnospiraceae bacterium]